MPAGETDWEAQKRKLEDEFRAKTDKLVAQHAEEVKRLNGELTRLRASLDNHLITTEATNAIAELNGATELLLPHVQR